MFLLVLKAIAAVGTAGTGLLALFKPTSVYEFTGLVASGARGISEIRVYFWRIIHRPGSSSLYFWS